jgi:4a-hydroxytetrahydrobiopterin dehydratase
MRRRPSDGRWNTTGRCSGERRAGDQGDGERGYPGVSDLAKKTCVPCRGGVPPLGGEELDALARQVPGWEVVDGHHLRREFRFGNFRDALDFVNRVGDLAEEQGHHPDISLGWGRVGVVIFTHKIDGLTESDFILAAKVDAL